jgi:predicted MFS family arabinose efflux permease
MKYSSRVAILMAVTFGIVGLERMVIAFVMPGIQQEFNLSYTQVGAIVSVFGFTWAIGSWLMGSISDYVGRRVVLVTLMIFGGVCSWLTGIAGSFIMLVLVRGVMGFAEGGVASPIFAVVAEESLPQSRAKNYELNNRVLCVVWRCNWANNKYRAHGTFWVEAGIFYLCRTCNLYGDTYSALHT